ncbi:MAG: DUF975 family protein [Clostridia bacterium]|nr:DUF975 family protein [Clostridia bacterium]
MSSSDYKSTALNRLQGMWTTAILAVLVSTVIRVVIDKMGQFAYLRFVAVIMEIFMIGFSYALSELLFKLYHGENQNPFSFISNGFCKIGRAFVISLLIAIRMLVGIIIMSFGAILILNAYFSYGSGFGLGVLFFIIGLIFALILSLNYVMAYYIAFDEPDLSSSEVVKKSKEIMNGNKGNYCLLILSFLGWILLISFASYLVMRTGFSTLADIVQDIGIVILTPYMMFSQIAFYRSLVPEKTMEDLGFSREEVVTEETRDEI